jgi:SM-20-related protein
MNLEEMIEDVLKKGYSIFPDFLNQNEVSSLSFESEQFLQNGAFKQAGIGKGPATQVVSTTRSDLIHWFDPHSLTPTQSILWERLKIIQSAFNESLFMGLWDLEGHYALYPPGTFYRRHRDSFQSDDARTLSIVVYFNQNWKPDDGGQLRIYPIEQDLNHFIDIPPRAGTLVCFLSQTIEHEVRPSLTHRKSFAGWFKKRSST